MKFTVTEFEHSFFKEWYDNLPKDYKDKVEQKGMPTEESIEKIWVSGFRIGIEEGIRRGPPRIGLNA